MSAIQCYSEDFENAVRAWAAERESKKRFAHTSRVVETVTELAEKWQPEAVSMLRVAGWIHDAAKHHDDDHLLHYARVHQLSISQAEARTPSLLHGIVAYLQAAEQFPLHDAAIRSACAYHTTGAPQMSFSDKLLFLADLIEPKRDFPKVGLIRKMAFKHVDNAMYLAVANTLRYLMRDRKLIDPRILDLYNVLVPQIDPDLLPKS